MLGRPLIDIERQQQVDRRRQGLVGDQRGRRDLGGTGERSGDEHRVGARGPRGFDVGADVADHRDRRRGQAESRSTCHHQAGRRFATQAPVLGCVRTHLPGVEGAELVVDCRIDGPYLFGREASAPDPGTGWSPRRRPRRPLQPVQHCPGAVDRRDQGGIPVVGDVVDERAVPVENAPGWSSEVSDRDRVATSSMGTSDQYPGEALLHT